MTSRTIHRRLVLASTLIPAVAGIAVVTTQQTTPFAPKTLTAADYARAEKFLGPAVTPLVMNASVQPNWLADGRFWYRATTATGAQSWLVDPEKKTRVQCDVPATPCTPEGARRRQPVAAEDEAARAVVVVVVAAEAKRQHPERRTRVGRR